MKLPVIFSLAGLLVIGFIAAFQLRPHTRTVYKNHAVVLQATETVGIPTTVTVAATTVATPAATETTATTATTVAAGLTVDPLTPTFWKKFGKTPPKSYSAHDGAGVADHGDNSWLMVVTIDKSPMFCVWDNGLSCDWDGWHKHLDTPANAH